MKFTKFEQIAGYFAEVITLKSILDSASREMKVYHGDKLDPMLTSVASFSVHRPVFMATYDLLERGLKLLVYVTIDQEYGPNEWRKDGHRLCRVYRRLDTAYRDFLQDKHLKHFIRLYENPYWFQQDLDVWLQTLQENYTRWKYYVLERNEPRIKTNKGWIKGQFADGWEMFYTIQNIRVLLERCTQSPEKWSTLNTRNSNAQTRQRS